MINAARGWTQEGDVIDAFIYPITFTPVVTFFMESKMQFEISTLWEPGWRGNSHSVALHCDSWVIIKVERLRLTAMGYS
ncbi:MAG: hypothetical protein E8D41_13595 [Nitrospira sp.]|nr:MAG: hypothetical protein E8D41_13595 [Nitrospira sp.]